MSELVRVMGLDGEELTATREEVDRFNLMAYSSRVFVITEAGECVLQLRAPEKRVLKNRVDFSAAETAWLGESDERTATRGLQEELTLNVPEGDLIYLGTDVYDGPEIRRCAVLYLLFLDEPRHGPAVPQRSEVVAIKLAKPGELEGIVADASFHPAGRHAFQKVKDMLAKKLYAQTKLYIHSCTSGGHEKKSSEARPIVPYNIPAQQLG